MKKSDFIVRPLTTNDIDGAMKLSTAEGWNQSESDWRLFLENPGNVCLAAEQDEKVIGTTTSMIYSDHVAWISMVLVDKEYRGRGVSTELLKHMLERLTCCRAVKLDATSAGQQVYKKLGFLDEHTIVRMTATSLNGPIPSYDDTQPQRMQLSHVSEVMSLDKEVFGAPRQLLIEYLVQQNPEKAWILIRNERISGFVLGRTGNRYHHVGPVVASDTKEAKLLIGRVLNEVSQQPIVVDVVYDKRELIEWLSALGFTEQRRFVRMYKNDNPYPGEIGKQYLICGPEFG